jgi:glycerol-1-phosphate dehydrogenase [NAD(P)+]
MTDSSGIVVDDLAGLRRLVAAAPDGELVHGIGLSEVVSGHGAVTETASVLARLGVPAGSTVAVLSDQVPKTCGESDVLDVVSNVIERRHATRRVVVHPHDQDTVVHADEDTLISAADSVRAACPAALVTVGSGTIADIGKRIAQDMVLKHVIVQTAASVNGYADDHSVLLVNGTKRTIPSCWPDALIVDSDVLAAAPPFLTLSGLGDQLSAFTATADWYLASRVGIDTSYSATALAVLRTGAAAVLACAPRLRNGDPAAIDTLAAALTHGGLAMGVAGRTAPSSGTEHTISHLLDMRATAELRPTLPHGAQVGAASVVAADVWDSMRRRLLAGRTEVRPLDPGRMQARVRKAFLPLDPTGAVAQECWSSYERKLHWINDHVHRLQDVCDEWADVDTDAEDLLVGSPRLADTLRAAGAPARFADLDPAPAPEIARWALANCHLMRDRFTIVDLAEVTGAWTDEDVDAVWARTQEQP